MVAVRYYFQNDSGAPSIPKANIYITDVIFLQDASYVIGKPLDLSHLKHIDLDIQGQITFTNDTEFWQANSFKFGFQDASSIFLLGGSDVNVYGGGVLEGNGQPWWDIYFTNKTIKRPVLFATVGLHGGSVSDISMNNSPFWTNIVANSSDVVFTDIAIYAVSHTFSFEKNTDGWDIYRSNNIVIQNSTVTNGDGMLTLDALNLHRHLQYADCVSFKPNATNILVQNLSCNGTHGISVGSLGQYPERIDIVENILVRNISMYNSSEGARIKVWPDSFSEKSASLKGGGGTGKVRNVTYDGMWLDNVDYGLTITQCYGQDDEAECFKHPVSILLLLITRIDVCVARLLEPQADPCKQARLNITDITFKNIRGWTNRVFAPIVAHLVCSSPETCSNIRAENIDIRTINGSRLATCRNMDNSLLDLECSEWSKGYNPA